MNVVRSVVQWQVLRLLGAFAFGAIFIVALFGADLLRSVGLYDTLGPVVFLTVLALIVGWYARRIWRMAHRRE